MIIYFCFVLWILIAAINFVYWQTGEKDYDFVWKEFIAACIWVFILLIWIARLS